MSSAARPLPAPTEALELLDDYQILARIGRGGMAEIFLARRPAAHGDELVVIKRLLPEDAEDPVILRMFLDEARLALRLVHPSIVRGLGLGMLEGRHALVLEFLEGQTLQAILRRTAESGRVLPLEVVVPLFAEVLEGLDHAHALVDDRGRPLSVVHRDVSPHNIFVTSAGDAKVLDFGIAKTALQEHRTRTGLLKGKVAYMAPEQALGARVDRRADVWSLGVTLWEALTATRLFKADNEAASLRLTLSGEIAKPSSVRPEIPAEIDRIVLRALQREPARRYGTAGAMAEELRAWARRNNVPMTAPARALMRELFERELEEQRTRITNLLTQPESVPISSTVPVLAKQMPLHEPAGGSHISTMTEFLGQLEEQQRKSSRRVGVLFALLSAVVLALGYMILTRGSNDSDSAARVEAYPIAQATTATATSVVPGPAVEEPAREPKGSLEPATTAELGASKRDGAPKAAVTNGAADSERAPSAPRSPANDEDRPQASPKRAEARPQPAAPRNDGDFGFLTLDTSPWSQVSADGVSLGQTPIVRARLSAGPHTLVLVNSERSLSTTYQVTIESGKTTVRRLGLD